MVPGSGEQAHRVDAWTLNVVDALQVGAAQAHFGADGGCLLPVRDPGTICRSGCDQGRDALFAGTGIHAQHWVERVFMGSGCLPWIEIDAVHACRGAGL